MLGLTHDVGVGDGIREGRERQCPKGGGPTKLLTFPPFVISGVDQLQNPMTWLGSPSSTLSYFSSLSQNKGKEGV